MLKKMTGEYFYFNFFPVKSSNILTLIKFSISIANDRAHSTPHKVINLIWVQKVYYYFQIIPCNWKCLKIEPIHSYFLHAKLGLDTKLGLDICPKYFVMRVREKDLK